MKAWSKIHDTNIIESVITEWDNLLNDKNQNEENYQKFLSNHSRFFFPKPFDFREQIIIEKLKFGADHISDFILCDGQRSYGFQYTLIEIESPHSPAFTKSNNPSARLKNAIQQIRDWQYWIESNREEAKRIFPSKQFSIGNVATFKYLIIIGRRDDNASVQNKIIFNSSKEGIEIRSFDYLGDILKSRRFLSFTQISQDILGPTEIENNEFSNPFTLPFSDSNWRKMIKDNTFSNSHMVGNNINLLLKNTKYNKVNESLLDKELVNIGNIIPTNEYKLLK